MGWNKHAHGVSRLRLVCFERGIPTEILADIEVINKPPTPNRVASYSDI
jgi:hypothetical protein